MVMDTQNTSLKSGELKFASSNPAIRDMNSEQIILATASYDHDIKLWEAPTGQCLNTLPHPDSQVNALEITPDCRQLAAAGHSQVKLYDMNNVNHQISCTVSKNVTAVGFKDDGKWMYTGGEDGTAKIWDLRSHTLSVTRIFEVNAPVLCATLHPNQTELYVGDQNGVINIWDIRTSHNEQLIPDADTAIQSIAVDPAGTYMAAVNNKGQVYVWRLSGGTNNTNVNFTPARQLVAHDKYALKVYFSPDSTLMVTTSADHTAKVWKTADFSLMTVLQTPAQRWVWDAAFSSDSQFVITGSSDNNARLWSVETGEIKREFVGHRKAISALAFRDRPI